MADEQVIKTVLELDLVDYSRTAVALEENLDVSAVKILEDQIQSFIDCGLQSVNLERSNVVFDKDGDNAVLIFDHPNLMHEFAGAVHQATVTHNASKTVETAKRWFRMGAATGTVLLLESEKRIVGTTVARAFRLETAAGKGELVVDLVTYNGLSAELKDCYGAEESVSGKRNETFRVRRCRMIPSEEPIKETLPDNMELLLKSISGAPEPRMAGEDGVQIIRLDKEKIGELKEKREKELLELEIERHPVVHIATNLLARAVSEGASDIHIEPKENETIVRFRIDGDMREMFPLQKETGVMLISRYKVLGAMDIAERLKPQHGAFEAIIDNRSFRLRLATTSTPHGESLIMRLLEPTAKLKDLKELGMTDKQVDTMLGFANRHQGFILIVGATGSGKTTTIYSLLSHIDCSKRSLITVEDPVEYNIPFANQQQVNVKAGVTFEALLKSSVRQDPDILYMGEMRDAESAETAIDFASAGHLTISTMHSVNATTAIFRLERLGISRRVMTESLLGIVSQRLLKKLCPYCKKEVDISREEIDMLSPFTDELPSKVAHPSGCLRCNGTGYLGREAVYEILEFTPEISEKVRSNTPIQEIRGFIRESGCYLMSDQAVEKVKKLIFSPKDAYEKILVEDREFGIRKPVKEEVIADKKTGDRRSILIVEDDKDTQRLLARLLGNKGYEVTIAGDGIEALLHLGKKEFALILSDIDMPNLDGLKLLEMKSQKGIETPVVFLTARAEEVSELKGLELGAVDYIRKPIQKEVLLLRIEKVLKDT